jgi:SAM-dependent methyltransferase
MMRLKVSKILFTLLCVLAFCIVVLSVYRAMNDGKVRAEGFAQMSPFSLRTDNNDIYDEFYGEIYGQVTETKKRLKYEINTMVQMTNPDKNNSVFLDIGCGTGNVVTELRGRGYRAFGIDKSAAMAKKAGCKCGDVMEPMQYEHNTFSHISCLCMTIYHLKDKLTFLKNCNSWLIRNGYLIIHMVEPDKHAAAANSKEFRGVKYTSSYTKPNPDGVTVYKETFQDMETNHVRQHELTLYMESGIIDLAKTCGFIIHGVATMAPLGKKYTHDYLYIFEKIG